VRPIIRCDWPGYRCDAGAEFFYKNRKEPRFPNEGPVKEYIARCRNHQPILKKVGGLKPVPRYDRISRELFIIWQVMGS